MQKQYLFISYLMDDTQPSASYLCIYINHMFMITYVHYLQIAIDCWAC